METNYVLLTEDMNLQIKHTEYFLDSKLTFNILQSLTKSIPRYLDIET